MQRPLDFSTPRVGLLNRFLHAALALFHNAHITTYSLRVLDVGNAVKPFAHDGRAAHDPHSYPKSDRTMTAHPAHEPDEAGVFEVAGPDGYVTLVVTGLHNRTLLRVEIATDCYSPAWVLWLERWARRWDLSFIRVVK